MGHRIFKFRMRKAVSKKLSVPIRLATTSSATRGDEEHRHAAVAVELVEELRRSDTQRVAVCNASGLMAIANARVVDLYQLRALRVRSHCSDVDASSGTGLGGTVGAPSLRGFGYEKEDDDGEAHAPFLGQIVLHEHVSICTDTQGLDEDADRACNALLVHATCVRFVRPGCLFVGVHAPTVKQDNPHAISSWLCGFRVYARHVALSGYTKHPHEAVTTHLAFADGIPMAPPVLIMHLIAANDQSGAVALRFDGSPLFAVMAWCERFSERHLAIAALPAASMKPPKRIPMHLRTASMRTRPTLPTVTQSSLTAIAFTTNADWAALGDSATGRVTLLDCRAAWLLGVLRPARTRAASVTPVTGKRVTCMATCRMGIRVHDGDSILRDARAVYQTHSIGGVTATCTSLRWWTAPVKQADNNQIVSDATPTFLMIGLSDGSLTVMTLVNELEDGVSCFSLQTLHVYPALRVTKTNFNPIQYISKPTKSAESPVEFHFSTVSPACWRFWSIGAKDSLASSSIKAGSPRVLWMWPTLKQSMDTPMVQDEAVSIRGGHVLPSNSKLAEDMHHQLRLSSLFTPISPRPASAPSIVQAFVLISLSERGVCIFTHAVRTSATSLPVLSLPSVEQTSERAISQYAVDECKSISSVGTDDSGDSVHDSVVAIPMGMGMGLEESRAVTTIQERYALPPRTKVSSHAVPMQTTRCQEPSTRMHKTEYSKRITSIAQRVDRLSLNLTAMRHAFHAFSNDIQQHFELMTEQLETVRAPRAQPSSQDLATTSTTSSSSTPPTRTQITHSAPYA